MKKVISYIFVLLSLLSVQGLAAAEEDAKDTRAIICIDTQKLVNKTDIKRANFSALVDRLTHEFTSNGVYRVVTMENFAAALTDLEKWTAGADVDAGGTKIVPPAYQIRLTVVKYGISSAVGRNMYGSTTRNEFADVEFIMTIVDAKTALTMKSVNISSRKMANAAVAARTKRISNDREQVLQAACQDACKKAVAEMMKYAMFYVIDVNGQQVTIDAPPSVAAVGSSFDIFKTGKKIRNRRTGKVRLQEIKVATIRITAQNEEDCTGAVAQTYTRDQIKTDYIARPAQQQFVPVTAAPGAVAPSGARPF